MCVHITRGFTYLNQVLAFGLGDQRLKLRCRECVDETGFGHYEEEDLSAGEDGKFVCL